MAAASAILKPTERGALRLSWVADFPGLRALAWQGHVLYASRGYELLCADASTGRFDWVPVACYRPPQWRSITSRNRLSARLCRDGFHALAVLPTGDMVAAVPGAIARLPSGQSDFEVTHKLERGSRPLHIVSTPDGRIFWGEYFNNPNRDQVHIYGSADCGMTWEIVYTFPAGAIRHVHNTVYDQALNCLWILTGDDGGECRILRAALDFRDVQVVLCGNQQARAVAFLPMTEAVYFSSDTPYERNWIYRLDTQGGVCPLAQLNSSSISGCRVGNFLFFSTMAEPSAANLDRNVRIYASSDGVQWSMLLAWPKDGWSMRYFQYGNALFPDGDNQTPYLAVSTIAVSGADQQTGIWQVLQD